MSAFTVSDNTQVNVAGTVYGSGETFTADDDHPDVHEAVTAGWVTPAGDEDSSAPAKRRRS